MQRQNHRICTLGTALALALYVGPVIAQETGFSRFIPSGDGLMSFHDEDSAAVAIERMNGDYESHRRAARAVAERYFNSDKVLGELLAKVT